MELFPFTLPKANICMETELYYRSSEEIIYEEDTGKIVFRCGTVLTFDTYFNGFSYKKYAQYTKAKILEVRVKLQGKVRLRLLKAEKKGAQLKKTELSVNEIEHEELHEAAASYNFDGEIGNGLLYLELTALTPTAVFAGGCYAIPVAEEDINSVKVAAVICTYCREQYIQRNIEYLTETIFNKPEQEISGHLEIFVVDNGRTLQAAAIEKANIKLFANKNYGGSGGFARGMIEVLRRKNEFTHVLLMDDDILLESSVLIKTIRFLQVLKAEYQDLVLGASMLCLDKMAVQNEAGARWTGIRIKQWNHNLDLRSIETLLENEALEMPQYTAWWYCCIPLCLVDENQLPVPFFVKIDDIEYSLRRFHKCLILNGIGVWHELYAKKKTAWLDYYNLRNKLVLNTIYEGQFMLAKNLFLVGCYIGKHLLTGFPAMIEFPVQGTRDYLKGIQHFKVLEADEHHISLLDNYKKLSQNKKNTLFYWGIAIKEYAGLAAEIISRQNQLKDEYKMNLPQITSEDYWIKKLGIS